MRDGRPTSPPGVGVGQFSSRRTRNEEVTTHSASAMPANRSGTGVVLFSEHEENGPKKPHHPPPPLGVPEEQSPADLPAGSGRTPLFLHSVAGSTVGCQAGRVGDLRCWSECVPASRNGRRAAAQPGLDAGGIRRCPLGTGSRSEETAEIAKTAKNKTFFLCAFSARFALSAVPSDRGLEH